MTNAIKSAETLLAELRTFLRAYNRALDTGDNSLAKDLLLFPYSVGGKLVMDQVTIARDYHVLSRLTGVELDNEAANYKLERLPGSFAVVLLTFFRDSIPTSDVIILVGTQATTVGTAFASPVVFETINQAVFPLSGISNYYSYDNARYEFPVIALCTTIGSVGNVGSETVRAMIGTITGITGVINKTAATNGSDSEQDDDLRERIKLAKTGRDMNVPNGVQKLMQDNGFLDSQVVRVEDPDAEKATGIDVFVIDPVPEAYTETFTYDPAIDAYYFTKRPVTEVSSVTNTSGVTLPAGQYSINIDELSPLRRSIYGQDYIEVGIGSGLVAGDQFVVGYNYSSAIIKAQAMLSLPDNKVLTADTLIKRAYPLYLYLNVTVTLKTNADGPTTRSRCRNAMSQFIATYRLGDSIQKSDLIVVLQTGFGDYPIDTVDAVVISSYYLQDELGKQYLPIDETILVGAKYYTVLGQATVV